MKLACYDAYNMWITQIRRVARAREHWSFVELKIGDDIPPGSFVFFRPTMKEKQLAREKEWIGTHVDRKDLCFVTDKTQCLLYEDKCTQSLVFKDFLPDTQLFTDSGAAHAWVDQNHSWPIVSKASVGASSQYVDIIGRDEALVVIDEAFGEGIPLNHPNWDRQRGYVLFQRFLPGNDFTWRVNVVGDEVAVFQRFNYSDRPVAQTGNTEPVREMTDEIAGVVEYARKVATSINSKWVALDILRDSGELRLIETSLAWPWPGVGDGALFFPSRRPWYGMFELMFDQMEQGVFGETTKM